MQRNRSKRMFLLMLAVLGAVGAANAHHGTAASYDQKKIVTIKGTVSEFLWRNPHSALFLDVKDASGTVTNYAIEMFSPILMVKGGYTRDVFKAGDEVAIDVHPSLAGEPSGECLGCKFLVNGAEPPKKAAGAASKQAKQ
jgi:hypothetical protein